MKKKVFILIITIIVCFVFGCGSTTQVKAEPINYMKYIRSCFDIEEWKDTETGVHYLIFDKKDGYGGMGGICPRYNADGSLYVD